MVRWARLSIVLTLTITVAGLPLVLDQCGAVCAAARAGAAAAKASVTSADPICQRAPTRITHLDGVPDACGHDHTSIDRATIGDTPQSRTLTVPTVAVVAATAVVSPARTLRTRSRRSASPPGGIAPALGSLLRI